MCSHCCRASLPVLFPWHRGGLRAGREVQDAHGHDGTAVVVYYAVLAAALAAAVIVLWLRAASAKPRAFLP